MIFVTVGTPKNNFERLIREVDNLVASKKIKENVVIQLGYTKYKPKNCDWFKFMSPDGIEKLCVKSRICITHGGVGSLAILLKHNKPAIVVPRMKKFNEHVDDHQLQIVRELEKQGRIIAVYDIKELGNAIDKAVKSKQIKSQNTNIIIELIQNFIQNSM